MFSQFDEYNFVRLVCPLAVGIIAYLYFGFAVPLPLVLLVILSSSLILVHTLPALNSSYTNSFVFGGILNVLIFVAGNYLAIQYNTANHTNYFGNHIEQTNYLTVQIEKPFVRKTKYFKSVASVQSVIDGEIKNSAKQKLYINIKDTNAANIPKYGAILVIKNKLFEISEPKNPGGFNYKRFSALKQIYFQTYLSPNDYSVICYDCGSVFWEHIYLLRNRFMSILETNIKDKAALAISSALLLGQKDYLTPDIQEIYADTGAMHILAVSGLHVGILLMILAFFFKPLENKKWGKPIRALLIISIIWIYAGITGFAPSVTRASLMFSIYLVGDALGRNKNIYNVLAASALLILVFKPNMIAEVGFQLSYAAVISIVWLYPYIYRTFFFSNRILDFFWSISAVSIAAQIGTFPISLYYFHQFPTTFFLANLAAIPSATVIFISGTALLSFGFIAPGIASFIGVFLESVIKTLNFALSSLEQLPFSTINFSNVHSYIPFLIVFISIGLISWLLTEKRHGLIVAACSLLIMCSSYCLRKFDILLQDKLVVYHNFKQLEVEHINGENHSTLNPEIYKDNKLTRYLFNPAHNHFGTKQVNEKSFVLHNGNFFIVKDKSIFVIDKATNVSSNLNPISVDAIILENNPYINFEELINTIDFTQVIFAANNSQKFINHWIDKCNLYNISYYNIKEDGALIWDLKQTVKL